MHNIITLIAALSILAAIIVEIIQLSYKVPNVKLNNLSQCLFKTFTVFGLISIAS